MRRFRRRSLSLVEAVISVVVVGMLLVAALETAGASVTGRHRMSGRAQGHLLAVDLLSEITARPFEEPDDTPVFGPEGAESTGDRSAFDDVDDYDGWTSDPPQRPDGTPIPGLDGWTREVAVVWALPADLTRISLTSTDIKRVTVTVRRNDAVMAELVALRTPSLPPPSGPGTILMVVGDEAVLTSQEAERIALLESWGYEVETIEAGATTGLFAAAIATGNVDVAYVPAGDSIEALGTKLKTASIGVVNEEKTLADDFGICSSTTDAKETQHYIYIVDNTHAVTSGYDVGRLAIFAAPQPAYGLAGSVSSDLAILARTETEESNYDPSLAVLEKGDRLDGGGTARGRRVQLPWGNDGFDIKALNEDGQALMQRAIEWAAESG